MNITYTRGLLLRHYGSSVYEPRRFVEPRNTGSGVVQKPEGGTGLWTSPLSSRYGWDAWCRDNNFRLDTLSRFFDVEFTGAILRIHTFEDLRITLRTYGDEPAPPFNKFRSLVLNFEYMRAVGVDGIHLTDEGEQRTRYSDPSLYGWDCECVLVLNGKCLRGVTNAEPILL